MRVLILTMFLAIFLLGCEQAPNPHVSQMEAKFNEQWSKKLADVDVDFLWLKEGSLTGELNVSNGRLLGVKYGTIALWENRDSAISGTYLKFESGRWTIVLSSKAFEKMLPQDVYYYLDLSASLAYKRQKAKLWYVEAWK